MRRALLWLDPPNYNFRVRLDLFKKTSPSFSQTGMGFLQKSAKSSKVLRAKGMLVSLAQVSRSHQTQLSLIASALKSKSVDFSKITEMIDGTSAGITLVATDMLAAMLDEVISGCNRFGGCFECVVVLQRSRRSDPI